MSQVTNGSHMGQHRTGAVEVCEVAWKGHYPSSTLPTSQSQPTAPNHTHLYMTRKCFFPAKAFSKKVSKPLRPGCCLLDPQMQTARTLVPVLTSSVDRQYPGMLRNKKVYHIKFLKNINIIYCILIGEKELSPCK